MLVSTQLKRLVERSEVALAEPAVLNSARQHLTDFAHVHRLVRVPAVLTGGRLRIFLRSFGAAAGAVQPKASAASTDYRFGRSALQLIRLTELRASNNLAELAAELEYAKSAFGVCVDDAHDAPWRVVPGASAMLKEATELAGTTMNAQQPVRQWNTNHTLGHRRQPQTVGQLQLNWPTSGTASKMSRCA